MAKSIPLRIPRQVHRLLPARRSGQVCPYLQMQAACPADWANEANTLSVDMIYFGDGIVLRCFGMSGYGGAVVPLPEKGERLCANPARYSCSSCCYLWEAHPMPTHAPGTGGVGASTEGGMGDSAVEVLGTIISSRTTGLGMSTALSPFSWGDSLRRVPAMDRPRPLHWCDAGTPTPAGTCVALLHRPTRLLSYSTRVHGALDPGSAFWIAA